MLLYRKCFSEKMDPSLIIYCSTIDGSACLDKNKGKIGRLTEIYTGTEGPQSRNKISFVVKTFISWMFLGLFLLGEA